MKKDKMIIGLTGRFGAGCTTTARFLEIERKFKYFSLSSVLKDAAINKVKYFRRKRGEERRQILQDIGDGLRKKNPTFLADGIIGQINKTSDDNVVVECFRNPAEVDAFRNKFRNFILISIDAEANTRWERFRHIYKNRDRFDRDDKRDAGGDEQPAHGQQVKKCIEISDILVNNNERFFKKNGSKNIKAIDGYAQKISDYLQLIQNPPSRKPNLDELYMHYACSVALTSHCLRRQVGAIIVKERFLDQKKLTKNDKKIIESYVVATGRNDVPIGDEDCSKRNEKALIKCYREFVKKQHFEKYNYCRECGTKLNGRLVCSKCGVDNSRLPGKLLDLCRAVHAEEAAILQAAKLGSISLENTKLYTSTFPCMLCCKKIINSGVKDVMYLESYPMQESLALEMLRRCKVKISKYEGVTSLAFNKLFTQQKNN